MTFFSWKRKRGYALGPSLFIKLLHPSRRHPRVLLGRARKLVKRRHYTAYRKSEIWSLDSNMKEKRHKNCDECEHSYMNRCCICLDIRTGVIILGLIHLVFQVAAIIVICQVLAHPDAFEKESPYMSSNHMMKGNNFVSLAISLLLFIVTAFMVYGTIQRRPGYLLPFFCLQMFDLCVCIMLLFGALTHRDQVVVWRSRVSHHYRYMRLDKVDQRCLIVTFTAFLIIKAYLANCVWTCYKLFVIRLKKMTKDASMHCCTTDSDFEALLPNYDDATKETPKESPPPYASD